VGGTGGTGGTTTGGVGGVTTGGVGGVGGTTGGGFDAGVRSGGDAVGLSGGVEGGVDGGVDGGVTGGVGVGGVGVGGAGVRVGGVGRGVRLGGAGGPPACRVVPGLDAPPAPPLPEDASGGAGIPKARAVVVRPDERCSRTGSSTLGMNTDGPRRCNNGAPGNRATWDVGGTTSWRHSKAVIATVATSAEIAVARSKPLRSISF
jgi:hypothetical protein